MRANRKSELGTMRAKVFSFLSPIHKATRQIARYLETPCAVEGVSSAEGHLLSYLRSYGPCPITDLLRVFGQRPSTATSMLSRLVERDLVSRKSTHLDRRVVLVGLTRRGAAAAERLRKVLAAFESSIHARLEEREVEGFRAVLSVIEDITRPPAGKESKPWASIR